MRNQHNRQRIIVAGQVALERMQAHTNILLWGIWGIRWENATWELKVKSIIHLIICWDKF